MAPLPENETVLVSLDYLKAMNVTAQGAVEFTPPRFTVPDDHIVIGETVSAAVVNGEGEIRLIPTDAGTYQITEKLEGQVPYTWHINVPTGIAGQSRSLFSFAPVQPIVQGVSVNTLLSGIGDPSALTGIDGDYYYDTVGQKWFGPKALGAWPVGFSVVGPAGTDGTDGEDGQDGAPGAPGAPAPAARILRVYNTSLQGAGDFWALPNTAEAWQVFSTPGEWSIAAVPGEDIEVSYNYLMASGTNCFADLVVVKGGTPTVQRYLASGSATPTFQGNPGDYPTDANFQGRRGTIGFTATADDIDTGGLVRFRFAVKTLGTNGRLYANNNYPLILGIKNNRTPAA